MNKEAAKKIMFLQKEFGDPMGLMYDEEAWKILGGTEEERQEVLKDFKEFCKKKQENV